jgi:phosphatidylserine/phosphatidylglycerophosphate/cardiolipin synthase-like enzyme
MAPDMLTVQRYASRCSAEYGISRFDSFARLLVDYPRLVLGRTQNAMIRWFSNSYRGWSAMPFFVLPDSGVGPVIEFIQEAQGPLIINNYFLDNRRILDAIRGKVQSGEAVYLILEPQPYGISASLVSREFQEAKSTGAYIVPAPPEFSTGDVFDHAKYAVAQNEALIGTANWDTSAFRKNREFIYTTMDPAILSALQMIGLADLKRVAPDLSHLPATLTVSPGAAPEIAPVLNQSGPVEVEAEELQPGDPLFAALENKGSQARLVLPNDLTGREQQAAEQLAAAGVQVRLLPIDPVYLHAKMIVGGSMGWIGSQNFSSTSLDENREVGIILTVPGDLGAMMQAFDADWSNGSPL